MHFANSFFKRGFYRIFSKTSLVIVLSLVTAQLSACSEDPSGVITDTKTAERDQLVTPDPALDKVTIPDISSIHPRILVDQNGYRTGSEKMVLFRGTSFPELFEIRKVEDDSVVFTGQVDKPLHASEDELSVASGSFTDFQTDGEYYIYAETLGASCKFKIADDVYKTLYDSALRQYYLNRCGVALTAEYAGDDARGICHSGMATLQEDSSQTLDITGGWHLDSSADRDVSTGCEIINNMLLAYEMNGKAFTDDVGIPESDNGVPDVLDEARYEVEWLLKMQDDRTGGVYTSALTEASEGENLSMADVVITPVSAKATIDFAGTLSWFGFLYKGIDSSFASQCSSAAARAYTAFAGMARPEDYTDSFLAAAQLYRNTGEKSYENVLVSFFRKDNYLTELATDDNLFLGSMCYLMTKQPVNTEVCSKIMKVLMDRAEEINNAANRSDYHCPQDDITKVQEILMDMRCIAVTNHILYSQEYVSIMESSTHYLLGRNEQGTNVVTDSTEYTYKENGAMTGILYDPVMDAELVVLLGAIKG